MALRKNAVMRERIASVARYMSPKAASKVRGFANINEKTKELCDLLSDTKQAEAIEDLLYAISNAQMD